MSIMTSSVPAYLNSLILHGVNPTGKKLVVVLMGESSRWTTKEHFVPPKRYTPYYYSMHKEVTFKR